MMKTKHSHLIAQKKYRSSEKGKRTQRKYRQKHKEKNKGYQKKYYEGHKERWQKYYLKYRNQQRNNKYKRIYGITLKEYNKLFKEQKGCCAICGTHQSKFKRTLSVDHDHITGEVRGLLCNICNMLVGWFEKFGGVCLSYLHLPS